MDSVAALAPYELPGVPVLGDAPGEFATEVLPAPPPLLSTQQAVQKRDGKKLYGAYSYLPTTDPGSTYSGVAHGTLIGREEPRSKRPSHKGASGRAQRASARNQNAAALAHDPSTSNDITSASGPHPAAMEAEPSGSGGVDDDLAVSRSSSSLNFHDPPVQPTTVKLTKRDKGKAKDAGTPPVRAKEEAKTGPSNTPEPGTNQMNNNDFCSACRSGGSLVYCDGCTRAFHFWCLDPPMESIDEGDSSWFCPACMIRKNPPRKRPASLLAPLLNQLDLTIPAEFQLPDDIRNFFRDVGTGPRGTYVDMQEVKPPKINRHGGIDLRDPRRLKDKNGAPVLCYKCGTSALPAGMASTHAAKRPRRSSSKAASPERHYKDIVSCDFCALHWHLDCLDPPLSAMPPQYKKWMCPNHAERLIPTKLRIPKQSAAPIEITKPKQWNNGHIDISQPETSTVEVRPRVKVDEVLINGRRYRVPEKIIIMDFWNKVSKVDLSEPRAADLASGLSSPLTSLSSLDDLEERSLAPEICSDDLLAAEALFHLSNGKPSAPAAGPSVSAPRPAASASRRRQRAPPRAIASSARATPAVLDSRPSSPDLSSQSATSTSNPPVIKTTSSRPGRSAKKAASLRITSVINAGLSGFETPTPGQSVTREAAPAVTIPVASRTSRKRKAPPAVAPPTITLNLQPQPEASAGPSSRALRSRSRHNAQGSSSSSVASAKTVRTTTAAPSPAVSSPLSLPTSTEFRTISVKTEEVDIALGLANGVEAPSASTNGAQTPAKRRRKVKEPAARADAVEVKEKRGRKRKTRDDELPEINGKVSAGGSATKKTKTGAKVASSRSKAKLASSPTKAAPMTPTSASSCLPPLTPLTVTPKSHTPVALTIRLPRLSNKIAAPALVHSGAEMAATRS